MESQQDHNLTSLLDATHKTEDFVRIENLGGITIFVLDGFNMVLILILILLSVFKHKVYGLTLWLLVGIEICVVFFVAAEA